MESGGLFYFLSSFPFPTLLSPPPSLPSFFLPFILHLFLKNKMMLLKRGGGAGGQGVPAEILASSQH